MRLHWIGPLLVAIGMCSCMPERPDPKQIFSKTGPPAMHLYNAAGRTIRTAEAGNPEGPLVLLVHGTPGGWDDFAALLADPALTNAAWVVAVDRPGWGGSGSKVDPSLAHQADALVAVLSAHPRNLPAVVAGHSLGAPIAVVLAMKHPELVKALVLVAGSVDPDQEKTTWYQAISRWPLIRNLVPKVLRKADAEILRLKEQLQGLLPHWRDLRMPVTILQGDKDALVPPANADFAERMLTQAPVTMVRIPNQGHLIHWQRPDLIRDAILPYIIPATTNSN